MSNGKFNNHPRPDPEVIDLLERVLKSARKGYVRTLAIVAVNPLHQAETGLVGDLSHVQTNSVLAGLQRTANHLLTAPKQKKP